MFSQITSVDLIVNQTVTVVTSPSTGSTRRDTLAVESSETIVATNSNIASNVTAESELVRTISSTTNFNNFQNQQNLLIDDSAGRTRIDYGAGLVDNIFNKNLNLPYGNVTANVTNYGFQLYSTPGTYTFTVPAGVTAISAMGVGGGGGGTQSASGGWGGFGGYTNYANAIPVSPGATLTVRVGSGGTTSLTIGNTGGDSSLTLTSNNFPVVYAAGGAGARSLRWDTNFSKATIYNVTQTVAMMTATSPTSETITYNVISGSLPPGLTYNSTTGNLFYTQQLPLNSDVNASFTLAANTATQSVARTIYFYVDSSAINITYLVVAGGGGGGGSDINVFGNYYNLYLRSGGGGAGGLISGNVNSVLSGTNYTVTVGNGGPAGTGGGAGGAGGNSSISGVVTVTGGGAGAGYAGPGGAGGSGGGGGNYNNGSGGTGIVGQGFNGGAAGTYNPPTGPQPGGGGGGAGGAAGAPGTGIPGPGVTSSITGTSLTYAAGGNGGAYGSQTAGGSNTGTGGSGGAASNGSAGGSGVVIISYPSAAQRASGGTVTSYTTGNVTYWVHRFTTSGTFSY